MNNKNQLLKAEAKRLGFSFCGVSSIKPTPHIRYFQNWVNRGFAGDMNFLKSESVMHLRLNPGEILSNAQSIIVVGMHFIPKLNLNAIKNPLVGKIASYACYEDYHIILREKINALIFWIKRTFSDNARFRVFVDSAPVSEKGFAFLAGLGWIGRNSLFIHSEFGSYCLIGCIITDLPLEYDLPFLNDICTDCQICISACPTGCILDNRTINASKCISYLTIEKKGMIPKDLRSLMGQHIFGCDDCQDVCPVNQKLISGKLSQKPSLKEIISQQIILVQEMAIDEIQFTEIFQRSVIKRISHEMYIRNITIAMGNSRSPDFIKPLEYTLKNQHTAIIRAHAAWALGEYQSSITREILSTALESEVDRLVRMEIAQALER